MDEDGRLHRNAYMRSWRKENRERLNTERRDREAADPEKKRTYMREWRAANKDKIAKHGRTYYARHAPQLREKSSAWYAAHPEEGKARMAAYYGTHVKEAAAYGKRRRQENPEVYKEEKHREYERHEQRYKDAAKKWREDNPDRAKANREAWKKANWGLVLAHSALRKAHKLQRTPVWADLDAIEAIYLACPAGYHVDHIIPLQGKTVSGLHVENNLQYLTETENLQKANKLLPEHMNAA